MRQSGVSYREFDLSRIAIAQGNLPAGIVTAAKRGAPFTRIVSTSPSEWLNSFGTPDPKISFASYAALAYLEQGNQLTTVRAVGAGALYGAVMLQKRAADSDPILFPMTHSDPATLDFGATFNGSSSPADNLGVFYPTGPGGYSKDLQVEIVSTNLTPVAELIGAVLSSGGILGAGTYTYAVTALNSKGETMSVESLVVTVVSGSTNSIRLSWDPVLGATGYKVYGRTAFNGSVQVLTIVNAPTYTDSGADTPQAGTSQPSVGTIVPSDEFTVNFYDLTVSAGKPLESHTVTLTDKLDGFGRQMRIDDVINTSSLNWRFINNSSMAAELPLVRSIGKTTLATGSSGTAVTDSQVIQAWNQLADIEQTNVRILINGGYSTPAVQKHMAAIADARQDCIAFLDMPSTKQRAQDAVDYRNNVLNLNTNRAALFAQDLLIVDSYNGRQLYVPPSGHMAALAARTAFVAAPWYPMAGLTRGQLNVLGVRHKYTEGEREMLKLGQINYVRDFPGQGIALFEQVTMQAQQTALSWISIRQLIDEIQLASRQFLLYSTHELNDDFLRRQIVSGLTDFLQDIQNRRGLQRFLVVCDARNNNAQTMGEGKLNVDIYLTPTLPAEQIILNGVLTKQDAVYTALIGTF